MNFFLSVSVSQPNGGCYVALSSGNSLPYENSIEVCILPYNEDVQRVAVHLKGPGGSYTVYSPDETKFTVHVCTFEY